MTGIAKAATHVFLGTPAVIASDPMQRLLALAERVARSGASVLITGESGCGKEMIARAVHHYSPRAHKAWVDLNCAALPENLLESELFGYEKGAFSGADKAKPGLFELAHEGTIFLDEIGEIDPRVQVKLLRVLDGAPYFRLGGVKKVSVDVRVVAATNSDLDRAVARGQFRNDLYHRLSQFTLEVPPLRARPADVGPLARHFLAQQYPEMTFSPAAVEAMMTYRWPGNIRELRNAIMRAGIMTQSGEIQPQDLPLKTNSSLSSPAPGEPRNWGDRQSWEEARSREEPRSWEAQGRSREAPAEDRPYYQSDPHRRDHHRPDHYQPDSEGHGVLWSEARSHVETTSPAIAASRGAGANENPHAENANLEIMERRMIFEALHATGGHHQKAAARLGISRRTLSRKLKIYGEVANCGDSRRHGEWGPAEVAS